MRHQSVPLADIEVKIEPAAHERLYDLFQSLSLHDILLKRIVG